MNNNEQQETDSFLEALLSYQPPVVTEFEYRVYYDPITKECTYKTIEKDDGEYVVVSSQQYEEISFSPNYYVSNGQVIKKKFDFLHEKLLKLSNTGYRTMAGHNMFLANEAYTKEVDHWELTRT